MSCVDGLIWGARELSKDCISALLEGFAVCTKVEAQSIALLNRCLECKVDCSKSKRFDSTKSTLRPLSSK